MDESFRENSMSSISKTGFYPPGFSKGGIRNNGNVLYRRDRSGSGSSSTSNMGVLNRSITHRTGGFSINRIVSKQFCFILLFAAWVGAESIWETASVINKTPQIDPDYTSLIIPPNIAPLNFSIREEGQDFRVRISGEQGDPFEIKAKKGKVEFPIKKWRKLLETNRTRTVTVNVAVKESGSWKKYKPILNQVAPDSIDGYLGYRLINPAFSIWKVLGLYQRNVESFEESPILINRITDENCMNCHNFNKGDPENMMLHLRGGPGSGTLIRWKGELRKVNTSTDFNRAGAYPSWHPNGKTIAFSVNKLSMFFHAKGESRDVMDWKSNLIVYHIDRNVVSTTPNISRPDRMETFPCWSSDGRYLYFCATDQLDNFLEGAAGENDLRWNEIRYDLMRIAYDEETDSWGALETVVTGDQVNGSITEPRVSPDGRFVLITVADYGNFPIYLKSADLYLVDLEKNSCTKLACNSPNTDSFHSWSSNGRWFVFSSKRSNGFLARPYFCYFRPDGVISKPFVLPQKDPAFYDQYLKTYNVPELFRSKVDVDPRDWRRVAYDKQNLIQAKLDPVVEVRETPDSSEPDLYKQAPK